MPPGKSQVGSLAIDATVFIPKVGEIRQAIALEPSNSGCGESRMARAQSAGTEQALHTVLHAEAVCKPIDYLSMWSASLGRQLAAC